MTPMSMRTSRVVLMALAVGTFFTAQEVLMDLARRRAAMASQDLVDGLEFWVVWALLAPIIVAAARRWSLNSTHIARVLVVHVGVALALSALHNVLTDTVVAAILYARTGGSIVVAFERTANSVMFVWGIFTGVVFYAVVIMLYSAFTLRAELTEAKLNTLRSQIRPHFLFNTLNAISVFVGEDAAKARMMILRLSMLLRRSLDQEAHEAPLTEELSFANDYLDIQRGRFGDRLSVVFDVRPETLLAKVPVFLLQPLLENAIEHGMLDDRPITITVTASRSADMLHVAVIDNGAGLTADPARPNGIGIANTRARLEHLYGAGASVDLQSDGTASPRTVTRVDIRLPYREMMR